MLDDIDLVNLAKYSTRFESIGKIVINQRYTRKYLMVNKIKFNPQKFDEFHQIFGQEEKAIGVEDYSTESIETHDHWAASLLNGANNHEKLHLYLGYNFVFNFENSN